MGLAPYGNPDSEQTKEFIKIIREHLVDIREDGSADTQYGVFQLRHRAQNDPRPPMGKTFQNSTKETGR